MVPMDRKDLRAIVVAALHNAGLNPYRAAVNAGLPADAIRNLIAGHEPKAGRLAQICAALGLEFYIGPPRSGADNADAESLPPASLHSLETSVQALSRIVAGAGRNPVPDDLWPVLAVRMGADRQVPKPEDPFVTSPPVDVVELEAATGSDSDVASEEVAGHVWFGREWLDMHGLHPRHCAVIRVRGESMEPTLPDGCSILVDRSRAGWRLEGIYVLRTRHGLVVNRAGFAEDGSRLLLSDHPGWAPLPWPEDAELVGEVCWVSRALL